MIGVDANLLVRFLLQDEAREAEMARSLFARCSVRDPAFIGREALVEAVRMLETVHGRAPGEIAAVVLGLLEAEEVIVEAADDVAVAAHAYGAGVADFADHMIAAAALRQGCATLYTSDRMAARHNAVTLLVK